MRDSPSLALFRELGSFSGVVRIALHLIHEILCWGYLHTITRRYRTPDLIPSSAPAWFAGECMRVLLRSYVV